MIVQAHVLIVMEGEFFDPIIEEGAGKCGQRADMIPLNANHKASRLERC
jgi:hypothetical protein